MTNIWLIIFSIYISFLQLSLISISSVSSTEIKKRFEYKLSFKGPNLILDDGTVPFWDHYGSALASDEFIRITPSLKSKKGSLWSKELNTNENWEIEVIIRVTGRGRVGADGLAIWYTTERAMDGPVFGNKDQWDGLAVIFDSFDNDMQQNNPSIMAMVNDGTKVFDHERDGLTQQLGNCLRDFRNKQFPVRVRIAYAKKLLTVHFHNGVSNADNFELCLRAEDVALPKNGFFGVSAATGGLADDHDVLSFVTHSLHFTDEMTNPVESDEWKNYEREYNEQRQKLEKAREDYRKEHPEKKVDEKAFEDRETRELQMIYQGQADIFRIIQGLARKMDEVVGKQETQLSLLTQQSRNSAGNQVAGPNSLQKADIEGLSQTQKTLSAEVRDLKALVSDIQARVQQKIGQEVQPTIKDMQSQLASVASEIRVVSANMAANCQQQNLSCVSTGAMVALLGLHLVAIIGYLIFQASKESASKKFY